MGFLPGSGSQRPGVRLRSEVGPGWEGVASGGGRGSGRLAAALTVEGQLVGSCHGRSGASPHPALRTEVNQVRPPPRPARRPSWSVSLGPPGLAANCAHRASHSRGRPAGAPRPAHLRRLQPARPGLSAPARPACPQPSSPLGPDSNIRRRSVSYPLPAGSHFRQCRRLRRRDSPGLFLRLPGVSLRKRTPSRKRMATAALKRLWSRGRGEAGGTEAAKPGVWARLGE